MKLDEIYTSLINTADNAGENAYYYDEDVIRTAADLILLLDEWATAKRELTVPGRSLKKWLSYSSAEAALLDACKGDEK